MSPRPRTVSDTDILAGTARAISRLGPARLTLAEVALEVGLAPATLLQRFGSKRALLLALAEQGVESVDAHFETARLANRSTVAALASAANDLNWFADSPAAVANHLAFLQVDLGDPDFSRLALTRARRILVGYQRLLDDAIAGGELSPCNTGRLARALQAITGGSLINWAIHQEGSVRSWLSADLDALLAPYKIGVVPAVAGGTTSASSSTSLSASAAPATRPAVPPQSPRPSGPRARHAG